MVKDRSNRRYMSEKPIEPTSLPKLSYDLSPQKVPNKQLQFQLNPLKRSVSMSQVLHGDGNQKSNHYIDCTLIYFIQNSIDLSEIMTQKTNKKGNFKDKLQ